MTESQKEHELKQISDLYRSALLTAFVPCGFLLGKNSTRECMKDDDIRLYLGNTLLYEIMPASHAEKSTAESAAGGVCSVLENAGSGLMLNDAFSLIFEGLEGTLGLIVRYYDDNGFLPWGLTFGFACLIMALSGARRHRKETAEEALSLTEDRFELLREQGAFEIRLPYGILSAFSRLACDMSPESLSYAALADVEIWGRDLREVPELEDRVAEHLGNLQMLGVREGMLLNARRAREASGL